MGCLSFFFLRRLRFFFGLGAVKFVVVVSGVVVGVVVVVVLVVAVEAEVEFFVFVFGLVEVVSLGLTSSCAVVLELASAFVGGGGAMQKSAHTRMDIK